MKLVVLCCVIYIVVVVYAEEIKVTSENEEVFREEYCNSPNNATKEEECSSYRCNKDNTKIIGVACAEARCSGKTVGFKGDRNKPYPDCCMVPICEDSNE